MGNWILHIDDDESEFELLKSAFRQLDQKIECLHAYSGVDGIKILESELSAPPDFVFLDVNLGIITGDSVLHQIRSTRELSGLKVIVYTNEDITWRRAFWNESGAEYFLTKPYLKQLVDVLKYLFGQAITEAELGVVRQFLIKLK